jgi:hypothetical protein
LQRYRKHASFDLRDVTALEIGTGWFPVVPIGMALSGVRRFYSIDMQDLLSHECVVKTLERYEQQILAGAVTIEAEDALERVQGLLARTSELDARGLLAALGIESLLRDARDTGLQADSIDLVCSNNTLEHIPRPVIASLFREFERLSSARGIMSHHIDLADHYVNFDASITVYNFLQYSSSRWSLFNNDLQYQNRLRVSDYRQLLDDTGWELVDEEDISDPIEVLRSVELAEEFRRYREEDLAVYECWLAARSRRHLPAGR